MAKAAALSVADLERILEERKVKAIDLTKRREDIQKQLDEVERQLSELLGEGRVAPRAKRRVKNTMSLRQCVLDVLAKNKKGLSMAELTTKIGETGYKSSSANFRNVLYQCLYNTKGISFDRATGTYRLK